MNDFSSEELELRTLGSKPIRFMLALAHHLDYDA